MEKHGNRHTGRGRRLLAGLLCAAMLITAAGCGAEGGSAAATAAQEGQTASAQSGEPSGNAGTDGEKQQETAQQAAAVTAQDAAAEEETQDPQEYYSRALARRSQKSRPEDAVLTGTAAGLPQAQKTWTVMVYMIGSNLESRLGNATKDLEEMAATGLSWQNVNLLVYTGGARRWVGDVPADRNCVLDLSKQGEERIVAQTAANANMGAPETLSGFVNFCTANYPAGHTALIFWDHGGGPLWGYGSDELFDDDALLLSELEAAMDATPFGTGERRLDIVGFDACLMASLENMALWQRYADYYIASEELEPGEGWDYTCLNVLEQTADPAAVCAAVVDGFAAYYEGRKTETYNPDVTLSCVDLSRLPALTEAFAAVAEKLSDGLAQGSYSAIMRQRTASKSFGLYVTGKGTDSYSYDLVDLKDLAANLQAVCPAEAAALTAALEQAVVCGAANVDRAGGISLYYPCRNKNQFIELNGVYKNLAVSDSYRAYLETNAGQWLTSRSRNWVLGEPEDAGSEYLLDLTEDQQNNMVRATYHILVPSVMGGLYAVMTNCSLEPGPDGALHLPKDLPMIGISADGGTPLLWPVTELESDAARRVYVTQRTRLRSDLATGMHLSDSEDLEVAIRVAADRTTGEVAVLSATESEGQTGQAGKNTVDVADWKSLQYSFSLYAPVTDANGAVRPFAEWSATGTFGWEEQPVREHFGFETVMTGSQGMQYYAQLEIEDVNGDHYASTPVPLAVRADRKTVTQKTALGEITYAVYADHTEVTGYAGTDTELVIPDAVEGVPVTKIGSYAFGKMLVFDANGYYPFETVTLPDSVTEIGDGGFYFCRNLTQIRLPEKLTRIGARAFYGCGALQEAALPEGLLAIGAGAFASCASLREITLPASLTQLEEGAFEACRGLQTIRTTAGNPAYRTQNDALLTADGKTLLAWPAAGPAVCTVPAGVETIAYGAFESAEALTRVELPASLQKIGSYAFFNCLALQAPAFPDSLTQIGAHAFDAGYMVLETEELPADPVRIGVGARLAQIGAHAFDLWLCRRFAVDADNPYYSEKDGLLMNRAGAALLAGSLDAGVRFVLPDGTLAFDPDMLAFRDSLNPFTDNRNKHIYLPASVVQFPEDVYEGDLGKLVFHCPAGSAAEAFALRHDIPCDDQTEYRFETVQQATPAGMLTVRLYAAHAMIERYEGQDEELILPADVQGKPVLVIGNGESPIAINGTDWDTLEQRQDAPNLKKIVIPEGVESISAKAIGMLSWVGQTEIVLPSTLKRIGESGLDLNTTVALPAGIERLDRNFTSGKLADGFTVTPSLKALSPEAFAACRGLTAFAQEGENGLFSVRDGVLYSADGSTLLAYPKDSGAAEVSVPEGVVTIGSHAFGGCTGLAAVTLPASLAAAEDYAFYNCDKLASVTFSDASGPVTLGKYAFAYCDALTAVHFGTTETIGANAFRGCSLLAAADLPEGLLIIGAYAFYDTAVRNVKLPDSLRVIGDGAFGGSEARPMTEEAELIIGPHVTQIGDSAFESLEVTRFRVVQENETYAAAEGLLTDRSGTRLICVPSAKAGELTVPEGTLHIEDWCFSYAKGLTRIHIPESVVGIGSVNFEKVPAGDGGAEGYTVTICCKEGSYAHTFAMERGIPFELE